MNGSCFNCDETLWVNFFKAYPDENATYVGDKDGCFVFIMAEYRAMFPSQKSAMDTLNKAREIALGL